jgi:hypothetical protein
VDDFDHYNNSDNRTWRAWHDGIGRVMENPSLPSYGGNSTEPAVGIETTASYMEETIVYRGRKSMPVYYDNSILRIW